MGMSRIRRVRVTCTIIIGIVVLWCISITMYCMLRLQMECRATGVDWIWIVIGW